MLLVPKIGSGRQSNFTSLLAVYLKGKNKQTDKRQKEERGRTGWCFFTQFRFYLLQLFLS
jgi:hypothetical protein